MSMTKSITDIAREIGELTAEKNAAYGDSFAKTGDILRILAPHGLRPEQYSDVLAIARILDKCFRIMSRKDAFAESPYRDLAGYGLIGAHNDERTKAASEDTQPVEWRAVPRYDEYVTDWNEYVARVKAGELDE